VWEACPTASGFYHGFYRTNLPNRASAPLTLNPFGPEYGIGEASSGQGLSANQVKRSRMVFISRSSDFEVVLEPRTHNGCHNHETTSDSLWSPHQRWRFTPDTTGSYKSIVPAAWRGLLPIDSSLAAQSSILVS
jgi:hypothetical protein